MATREAPAAGRPAEATDVLSIVRSRRSVREFTAEPVPQDVLGDLVEALRWAPSAGNLQSRRFYFILNDRIRLQLAEAAGSRAVGARVKKLVKMLLGRHPVASAPVVVVACLDRGIAERYGERGEQLYAIQDVATSLTNLMLVAHERGLGTVWIGAFDEARVAAVLDLPKQLRPVALVPVGYPARVPPAPPRVAPEQVAEIVK